jgi:NAD(P)H-nitrite reductase large subunit
MGKKVLIVGAGPAGLAAAEAAALRGAEVRLCGGESYPPYWRPRLTHWLSEPVPIEKLAIRKPEWYAERGIRLETGKTAVRVDTAGKAVRWADGSADGYDALVLAAGAEPNMPQIPGAADALALRGYDDAARLREAALAAGRAVIVGGGLLGLETAWELNAAGVGSTLVERNRWLMPRQLDRPGGQYLQRKLEARGIVFVVGQDPALLGELYHGACVVLAAGVRANLAFLEGSGVTQGRGVTVDDRMRASAAGVYACGDIAEFMGRSWGLLPVAEAQGKVAGANAAGGDEAYAETPPSPVLKTGDVAVFSVGDVAGGEGVVALREENEAGYKCLFVREGVLVGAALIGDMKAGMKLKKAVAEKRRLDGAADVKTAMEML